MPIVRVIPAKKPIRGSNKGTPLSKRRVAGYARVSTDREEQASSYEAQIDYYTSYINNRPDWEFVKVYTDEGISGTSMHRREGFKQMVADAIMGKIDLIVTKSVSRFARNTVDSLTTIRKLKESNVECFFEKENIWTFDGKGELLITIMSSIAQEESRSISENTTWGKRKLAKEGRVMLPFASFLGYDQGPDGKMVVNEKQAEIVKLIYAMFLQGKTVHGISAILTEKGIPTPAGKRNWSDSCVSSILKNEKYIGDALIQKRFTVDFLSHKMKVNEGEVPQYYVEGHHEPIIAREVYALVQTEFKRRKGMTGRRNRKRILSARIKCAQCGSWFGEKKFNPNSKYEQVVWQCNGKYDKSHEQCTTGNLKERDVQQMFVIAVNKLLKGSSHLLETQRMVYDAVFETTGLERERTTLIAEMSITAELMDRMARRNTSSDSALGVVDDPEYEALLARYEQSEARKQELDAKIQDRLSKKALATSFFEKLVERKDPIDKFDEELWDGLLSHLVVHSPDDVRFVFLDGSEIKVDMPEEGNKQPPLTEQQKAEITRLRCEDLPYAKIGEMLDIPRGQVRSYCLSRTAPKEPKVHGDGNHEFCKTCGKELEHTPGFRKKMFCSAGCRQDWWLRKAPYKTGEGYATHLVTCKGCGKTFVAYGTKRRYCNRQCYLDHMKKLADGNKQDVPKS